MAGVVVAVLIVALVSMLLRILFSAELWGFLLFLVAAVLVVQGGIWLFGAIDSLLVWAWLHVWWVAGASGTALVITALVLLAAASS